MHTHHLMALFPGLPRWAGTRKVKPIWISLKQETVSGSGISWAICKSAPRSRQITTPAPHHSLFYRPDALPTAQPTASKHWRHIKKMHTKENQFLFSASRCISQTVYRRTRSEVDWLQHVNLSREVVVFFEVLNKCVLLSVQNTRTHITSYKLRSFGGSRFPR